MLLDFIQVLQCCRLVNCSRLTLTFTERLGSLLGISFGAGLAVLDGCAELIRHGLGGKMQALCVLGDLAKQVTLESTSTVTR